MNSAKNHTVSLFYFLFLIRMLISFLSHVSMLTLLLFMQGQYLARVPKSAFPWKKEAAFYPHLRTVCSPCQQGEAWLLHQGRQAGDKGDSEAGRDLTDSPTAPEQGEPGQLVTATGVSHGPRTTKPDHRDKTGSRSSREVTSAREAQDQRGTRPGMGIPTA